MVGSLIQNADVKLTGEVSGVRIAQPQTPIPPNALQHIETNFKLACQVWSIDGRLVGKSNEAPTTQLTHVSSGYSNQDINGTGWRVTELSVKISRFKDDDFVEDARPVVLIPPGAAVDAGVADLLSRVAPDRKKAGLNPSDTGPFEGKAGAQPENFRWEIESARGYPPR